MITRFVFFIVLFLNFSAWSQSDQQILSDKFRLLVFQLEKSLSSGLKERLSPLYPNEIVSVQVKLTTNPEIISKRLGLTSSKPKFDLPGLDNSKEISNNKVLEFSPSMSDVVSIVTKMDVSISTSVALNMTQTSDIQQIIESEVSALGIKSVAVNFPANSVTKSKVAEKAETKDSNEQSKDLTIPFIIIASGLVMALVISGFLHLGMKRIETNLKELNNGLANLATSSSAPRAESAPSYNKDFSQMTGAGPSSNGANDEDITNKIQKIIQQSSATASDYFQHVIDIQDPAKMLILMEALNHEERLNFISKMPPNFKKDYDLFLNQLQTSTNTDEILKEAMREMIRDFKLIPHDDNYLIKKGIKYKISHVKKEDIPKIIENSNENEFAYLLELIEPVTLASALALNPNLLNKYSKITSNNLDVSQLKKLSEKLNRFSGKSKNVAQSDLSLFLTPELETEFNKKTGKSQSSWESFSEPEMLELERFARSLSVNDLSAFIAIVPENLKDHILKKLPDIKAQQLQRMGIKLTDQSFRLKYDFLAKNSKGTVQ